MTGTYAGQFAMEGFLNLKWARWRRVLVTRTIAIIPTFCVALFSQIDQVTKLNDYLNAVMALQLPFATIPTIAFTSSRLIMGDFVNGTVNRIISVLLSFVVIFINLFFIFNQIKEADLSSSWNVLVGKFISISYHNLITHNLVNNNLSSYILNMLRDIQHIFNTSHGCTDGKQEISSTRVCKKVHHT